MPRKTKAENVARFVIGSRVRVKIGMGDPDFPDMSLGGWSGKIREIGTENGLPTYLVAWDRYTRRHIAPLFRSRCEEAHLDPDSMWLGEDFLEPEQSPPTVNEQPQNLFYRPIGMNSEERRSDRTPEPQSADEWQACEEPEPMLACLQCKASERKFRLFAVACCRRVWGLLRHDRYRQWVETAEQYADGQVTEHTIEDIADALGTGSGGPTEAAHWCCAEDFVLGAKFVSAQADRSVAMRSLEKGRMRSQENRWKAALIRDLFGSPFHPITIDAACRTPIVLSLAQAAYDERQLPSGEMDPQRLTVLADALEELGAPDEQVDHLRSPGPHVRGCWAIDAVAASIELATFAQSRGNEIL